MSTNATIVQVIQQCGMPDESKLNALALFALLRLNLTCNFASFVRCLDGPARADVAAFTQAMQDAQVPAGQQVGLLAAYLDAQEAGMSVSLRQYADALMVTLRRVEEAQFVDRVVQSKPQTSLQLSETYTPQAPSLPTQPAAVGGWGALQGHAAPGPQVVQPQHIPATQMPSAAAVAAAWPVPASPVAGPQATGVFATGAPPTQDGWSQAVAAANAPPKEADIPTPDPVPEWFQPGARALYELGDQKVPITVTTVTGRHANIVSDEGQTWHSVAPVQLEPRETPYEFRATLAAYQVQELEDRKAKVAQGTEARMLSSIVDFTRVSPIDGGKLHISLELHASGSPIQPFFYCFRLQDANLNELDRVTSANLNADWRLQFHQRSYHLRLDFGAAEPTRTAEPAAAPVEQPVSAPAKKAAVKKTSTPVKKAAVKKKTPKAE